MLDPNPARPPPMAPGMAPKPNPPIAPKAPPVPAIPAVVPITSAHLPHVLSRPNISAATSPAMPNAIPIPGAFPAIPLNRLPHFPKPDAAPAAVAAVPAVPVVVLGSTLIGLPSGPKIILGVPLVPPVGLVGPPCGKLNPPPVLDAAPALNNAAVNESNALLTIAYLDAYAGKVVIPNVDKVLPAKPNTPLNNFAPTATKPNNVPRPTTTPINVLIPDPIAPTNLTNGSGNDLIIAPKKSITSPIFLGI